jgi:hypothetical protein
VKTFLKNQYNGFKMDETLASHIRFSAVFTCWEISFKVKVMADGREKKIFTIKDDVGARFGCFSERLANSLVIGEKYQGAGEVKIGKGSTFLNLEKAEPMNGSAYKEES